jgi:hypothetical protein
MVPQPQYGNGVSGLKPRLDRVDLLLRNLAPVGPRITEVERELELRSGLQHFGHLGRVDVQRSADRAAGRFSHFGSRRLVSDHPTVGESEQRQVRAVPAPGDRLLENPTRC